MTKGLWSQRAPFIFFAAAKRDPTTYAGPGNGAFGWKLFAMHWKLIFWDMNDIWCLALDAAARVFGV